MLTYAKRTFVIVKVIDGSERAIRFNSITVYYQYTRKKGRQSIAHGQNESYP